MSKKVSAADVKSVERRKHWRDRRASNNRRNSERMRLVSYDCRTGQPRRQSDLTGEVTDGEIWWNKDNAKVE